jgi:DNA mismatch repair protein MutL
MRSRPAPSFTPGAQPVMAFPDLEFTAAHEQASELPVFEMQPPPAPERTFDFAETEFSVSNRPEESSEGAGPTPSTLKLRPPETHGPLPSAGDDANHSMRQIGDLRPLGQLHNSFIIAAGAGGLWIVDQHVAHERILFEEVLAQQASGRIEIQQLLMPIVLQLSPAQQIEYARIADDLRDSGFDTEPFGHGTIAVKAAPAAIGLADLERALLEILEIAEHELRTASVSDLRRGIAASIACRAAIKINTPLDQRKMEWLLRALSATEYPMACPHGRPIALQYGTREILRAFHRI